MAILLAGIPLAQAVAAEKAGKLEVKFLYLPPKPDWKELAQSEFGTATHDNIWETKPHATTEFFAKVNKPFVAYKVLAAGAIMPRDGFKFALENGADFLSIGMYDFQLAEDVNTIKSLINPKLGKREWASPHVTA
jgi:hypothetical protein